MPSWPKKMLSKIVHPSPKPLTLILKITLSSHTEKNRSLLQ